MKWSLRPIYDWIAILESELHYARELGTGTDVEKLDEASGWREVPTGASVQMRIKSITSKIEEARATIERVEAEAKEDRGLDEEGQALPLDETDRKDPDEDDGADIPAPVVRCVVHRHSHLRELVVWHPLCPAT
eukprot:SAG31_NODE_12430_length_942_cov_5.460261_2_plen_134_part_00